MRTLSGVGRWMQRRIGRGRVGSPAMLAQVRPLAAGRRPLLTDQLGEQRRSGARLDQVDGTTCGSAVLVALAAWADPTETRRLDGEQDEDPVTGRRPVVAGRWAGFGDRYDARQKQVHRESTRFWPRALGTSPWGMATWLRRHAPAVGRYRVRLVDDTSADDVTGAVTATTAALAAGRPVPLLVGDLLPRHYVLAMSAGPDGWRVYEPSSGQLRLLSPVQLRTRAAGPILGFPRWHAVLLPG